MHYIHKANWSTVSLVLLLLLKNYLLFCHFLYIARWATRQELTLYVLSLVSLKPNVRRLLLSVSLLLIFPFQSAGHFSAWTIKVKQMNITQIINYNCYIAYDKHQYIWVSLSQTPYLHLQNILGETRFSDISHFDLKLK